MRYENIHFNGSGLGFLSSSQATLRPMVQPFLGGYAQTGGIYPDCDVDCHPCHRLRNFDEVTANVTDFLLLSAHC
jgi:hypothetical protein